MFESPIGHMIPHVFGTPIGCPVSADGGSSVLVAIDHPRPIALPFSPEKIASVARGWSVAMRTSPCFSLRTGWWYTYPSEKNMKVSWGYDSQYIYIYIEKYKMFQSTNQRSIFCTNELPPSPL